MVVMSQVSSKTHNNSSQGKKRRLI